MIVKQSPSKPLNTTRKRKLEEISIELSDFEKSFGFNQVAQTPKKRLRTEQLLEESDFVDLKN